MEYATLEWVDWFNNRRLLEPIGNVPPAEAERSFCADLETKAMDAQLTKVSLRKTRRGSKRRRRVRDDERRTDVAETLIPLAAIVRQVA